VGHGNTARQATCAWRSPDANAFGEMAMLEPRRSADVLADMAAERLRKIPPPRFPAIPKADIRTRASRISAILRPNLLAIALILAMPSETC